MNACLLREHSRSCPICSLVVLSNAYLGDRAPSSKGLRLVLDTNVWLDWLVFDDPGILPLKSAVEAGEAEVFMASACENELARVLSYPLGKAALDANAQAMCLQECRKTVRWLEGSSSQDVPGLPVCRDPADQKFLELARDCGADFLVTKDRALLILARRKDPTLSFQIITPQQFTQWKGADWELPRRSTAQS